MMMNVEMEGGNDALHDEIAATAAKVQAEEVRSVKKGNTKFKRMLLKAYHTELKHRLLQWKSKIVTEQSKGEQLRRGVLNKWQKRLYREAFDKFRNQHKSMKREIK